VKNICDGMNIINEKGEFDLMLSHEPSKERDRRDRLKRSSRTKIFF